MLSSPPAAERTGNVARDAGGLTITEVRDSRSNRRFKIIDGKLMVSNVRGALVVEHGFAQHANADGLLPGGSTGRIVSAMIGALPPGWPLVLDTGHLDSSQELSRDLAGGTTNPDDFGEDRDEKDHLDDVGVP